MRSKILGNGFVIF